MNPIKRITYSLLFRLKILPEYLTILLNGPKHLAVFLYYPMHMEFLKDTIKILEGKGVKVHYFVPMPDDVKLFNLKFPHIPFKTRNYLKFFPFKLLLTPATVPEIRSRVNRKTKTAHVFHSLVSTHLAYSEGSFEEFDYLLCAGPHQKNELLVLLKQSAFKHRLLDSGYEITERLRKLQPKNQDTNNIPSILFSPSHGNSNSLRLYGNEIIAQLINSYKIILRPHVISQTADLDIINELIAKYSSTGRLVIDTSTDSTPSMLDSSIMISDYSGIAIEYALSFNKPVLFIDGPKKVGNPKWESYPINLPVEVAYRDKIGQIVYDVNTIKNIVDTTLNERELWQTKISKLTNELLFNPDLSSTTISNQVIGLLNNNIKNYLEVE